MVRRPGSGKTPRQAPDTASPAPISAARRRRPDSLALPADLGRSLRLLDDAQFDQLAEAMTDEVRRRGRNAPDRPRAKDRSPKRAPEKAQPERPDKADRTVAVTAGKERLILAAFDAGLGPAVIAKEFRVSRSAVQHVITDAKRNRRSTER